MQKGDVGYVIVTVKARVTGLTIILWIGIGIGTFYKDVGEYGKRYVSDDDKEEESVVVSDIGEYDTEDDDNFILGHLEALCFNFDELGMLGCETLMS